MSLNEHPPSIRSKPLITGIIIGIPPPPSGLKDDTSTLNTTIPNQSLSPRRHPPLILDKSMVMKTKYSPISMQKIDTRAQYIQRRLNTLFDIRIYVALHERTPC